MAAIFCADCGTECALVDGRDVDAHNPEIADAWVWACPVCPASWAHQDKAGVCVGLPAGQATVNARALLRLQVMVPLVRQAPPNEQTLAAARVRAFAMTFSPALTQHAVWQVQACINILQQPRAAAVDLLGFPAGVHA